MLDDSAGKEHWILLLGNIQHNRVPLLLRIAEQNLVDLGGKTVEYLLALRLEVVLRVLGIALQLSFSFLPGFAAGALLSLSLSPCVCNSLVSVPTSSSSV